MPVGLEHITFGYTDTPILRDFSLMLPERGAVCLFGASGCGKSTVLRLLAGLETPQSGRRVGLDGKRLSVVFQENSLLPWRTVYENAALPVLGTPREATVRDCLRAVGLETVENSLPRELSGGMKRRVAIARAMAQDGDVLLLDEPFAGLDKELWTEIAAVLRRQFEARPTLLITHIAEEAEALCAPLIPMVAAPFPAAER